MYILLLTILTFINSPKTHEHQYDIRDFGAVGNGRILNTQSIQKAIDKANKNGGGTVDIPAGRFLTGTIILKSNVDLHLMKHAVLLGSTNPYDYPSLTAYLNRPTRNYPNRGGLIEANHVSDISVTGNGTIDGQGRKLALKLDSLFYAGKVDSAYYNLRRKRPDRRPGILGILKCDHFKISGVTIKNSAGWVQTYELCHDLTIDHIRVESDAYWNNDGMDIVDCTNVRVTNDFVNSADDGICLKSENKGALDDSIYVADCTIRSSASAVKFGTASVGGFRNVTIKNIKVFDTFRSAIAIESVDGGSLENILVDGITATNTGNPIFIRLGHRNVDGRTGTLHNVVIKNVNVQVPFGRPDIDYDLRGPALPYFHNPFPSSIVGMPGHPVKNVTLENIEILYPGNGNDGLAYLPLSRLGEVPEVAEHYPEFSMFGELPSWGFYVRHVHNLTLKNVFIAAEKPDYRPAYVFDNVKGLTLQKMDVHENDVTGKKQFIFKDVTGSHLNVDKQRVRILDH